MFNNIGNKIKSLAIICTIVGMALSIIIGIILLADKYYLESILIMIIGCFASWVGSFVLYAYGQISTDLQEINLKLGKTVDDNKDTIDKDVDEKVNSITAENNSTADDNQDKYVNIVLDEVAKNPGTIAQYIAQIKVITPKEAMDNYVTKTPCLLFSKVKKENAEKLVDKFASGGARCHIDD